MVSSLNKHHVKQFQDQGSTSFQSTSQSHCEGENIGGSTDGKCISGYNKACKWQADGNNQSVFPQGASHLTFPPSQSVVHVPYPYACPYYGGYLPAIGAQFVMHPQIVGMAPARVQLPPDYGENEPIFVNSKQYHGILRRRQSRAKLEAQNKLVRDRKPYLHESRHLHALKRARGCSGRFLNKKKLQSSDDDHSASDPASLHMDESLSEPEVIKSESGNVCTSTTSCSSLTSSSNKDDMLQPSKHWLSGYHPHIGENMQDGGGGITFNGSQLRVPVLQ
ncbi:Nuclear transcription factor y subunit a-3 [Thalictrum thalictroides]|uniref:Nuclear transcription factor Y subunit n=1 Tax=Thalictrum thalictroides TaxID=46969 RepID=A0A7J6URT8_THATH|nr:Nuclear transcription factor y subunit a-3 [Thalictrum thalictroides]